MKYSISRTSLLIAFAFGLTACGGGGGGSSSEGGGSTFKKFDGTWNAACETAGTRSYTQKWVINGESLNSDVNAWLTSNNCSSGSPKLVKVKATIDYKDEVTVANTCEGGKAQQVDVIYNSLSYNGTNITGEQNIQGILTSQGISTALPKYGLLCKGTDGKLYPGLLTTDKDASTAAKRPTEMDTTKPLTP